MLRPAVQHVDPVAEHHPTDADVTRLGVKGEGHNQRKKRAEAAEHCKERHIAPPDRHARTPAVGARHRRMAQAQPEHRGVGGCKREHRAEGVHVAEEVGLSRDQHEGRNRAKDEDRKPRRLETGVELANSWRELAVVRHRIGQTRHSDDAGVRRDEQNGCREDADVDLHERQEQSVDAEVFDDAEDRVGLKLGAEPGLKVVAHRLDGQRRQGHKRDARVHDKHGDDRCVD